MKKIIIFCLFATMVNFCYGQLKMLLELNTANAIYNKKTEEELKLSKGKYWTKYWEEECKPSIYDDICEEFMGFARQYHINAELGYFEDAEYVVYFELNNMDEDGEFEKNGNETKHYSVITSKAFRRAAYDSAYKIFRVLGFNLRWAQEAIFY